MPAEEESCRKEVVCFCVKDADVKVETKNSEHATIAILYMQKHWFEAYKAMYYAMARITHGGNTKLGNPWGKPTIAEGVVITSFSG